MIAPNSIRVYVQVGARKLKCVAESEGTRYRWDSSEFSERWGGPEASIILTFKRRGAK